MVCNNKSLAPVERFKFIWRKHIMKLLGTGKGEWRGGLLHRSLARLNAEASTSTSRRFCLKSWYLSDVVVTCSCCMAPLPKNSLFIYFNMWDGPDRKESANINIGYKLLAVS